MKGYKIKCTDVKLASDGNKLVEFFRIHMLLTPLWLVLVLQYPTNSSFMVLSSLVRRHERSFVVHLQPAKNRCDLCDLCDLWRFMQLGSPVQLGQILTFFRHISNPTDVMNWL